jgi:hypothetical protein
MVTIDEILSKLEPAQKEKIQTLRVLVKSAVPEAVEIVRQGKIAYKLNGKDFVWISHYQDHVDLEFYMGASLGSDLLRSRGVTETSENVRHIAIGNIDKLKPEITRLLKQAATGIAQLLHNKQSKLNHKKRKKEKTEPQF